MTLEQLNKEVQSYIQESYEMGVEYKKERDDLEKKVSEGLKGPIEVEKTLEAKKQYSVQVLKEKSVVLNNRIEEVRELEIKKIDSKTESVTADALAELNLLSQLDVSGEDVKKYIDKYKNTPLALRKLKSIAKENKVFAEFPEDRSEQLDMILKKIENSVNRFKTPDYLSYDAQIKMLVEGKKETHQQDVANYRSL